MKKLLGLWALSSLIVGAAGIVILYFSLIAAARSLEWPGGIAIVLSMPFIGLATVAYYSVGALIVFGIAIEKIRKNSLRSGYFLYVSKMNLMMLSISFVLAITLQFAEVPVGTASIKEIVHIGPYDFINKSDVVYEIVDLPSPAVGHIDVFARYNNGNIGMILKPLLCISSDPDIVKIEENTPGWNGCSVRFLMPGKTIITAEYEQLRYSKNLVIIQKK